MSDREYEQLRADAWDALEALETYDDQLNTREARDRLAEDPVLCRIVCALVREIEKLQGYR